MIKNGIKINVASFLLLLFVACTNCYNCEKNLGIVYYPDSINYYSNCVTDVIFEDDTITNEFNLELPELKEVYINKSVYFNIDSTLNQLSRIKSLKKISLDLRGYRKIPESIALLTNIKSLSIHIDSNVFIPEQFYKMSQLKSLFIHSNAYVESLELDKLYNLEELALECNIKTVPLVVFKLSNLRVLNLSFNSLLDSIPSEIKNLKYLREINIVNTNILKYNKDTKKLDKRMFEELEKNCSKCKIISNLNIGYR